MHQGLIREAEIDTALRRLMLARMRLGMFDPPERVPWSQIPYSVNQSPEHDALARRAAQESIVLLKNDGVLPLSRDTAPVAVIGPTADDMMALLGNYYGTPTAPVTILRASAPRWAARRVLYARGADLVEGRARSARGAGDRVALPAPRPEIGEHGLKGEYFRGRDCSGEAGAHARRCARRLPLGSRRRPPTISSRAASCPPAARSTSTISASAGPASCCRRCPAATRLSVAANDGLRL